MMIGILFINSSITVGYWAYILTQAFCTKTEGEDDPEWKKILREEFGVDLFILFFFFTYLCLWNSCSPVNSFQIISDSASGNSSSPVITKSICFLSGHTHTHTQYWRSSISLSLSLRVLRLILAEAKIKPHRFLDWTPPQTYTQCSLLSFHSSCVNRLQKIPWFHPDAVYEISSRSTAQGDDFKGQKSNRKKVKR